MRCLDVDLGERGYPIFIGDSVFKSPDHCLFPFIASRDVLIVTNEVVAPLYLQRLLAVFNEDYRVETLVLPDGEQYKTLATVNLIYDHLLEHRCNRDVTVIALGGGVIGDMTGFAAASYQRGVPFIQIPTTLLAQVDSSVGGKTGVNHPLGKNMIGAFYQPQSVMIDISTLNTLDERQLKAGLAEVIKYGLIYDEAFLTWIENHMDDLLAKVPAVLIHAIETSCRIKADIVAADERETGLRAILNLGHTFGHAIETGMGYGEWLHGEAVAAGMVMAADLSERLGWINKTDGQRLRRIIERAGLPLAPPPEMPAEQFSELMALDKKVQSGQLRLVLLKSLGQGVVTDDFSADQLDATLARFCRR